MPRFFDDYSNTYLTHDSAAGRKQQRRGWKFRENFKLHYSSHIEEWQSGPMGLAAAQQAQLSRGMPPPPLPPGWTEEVDLATNMTFYTNTETGKRTWVRPGFRPGGPMMRGGGGPPPPAQHHRGPPPPPYQQQRGPPPPFHQQQQPPRGPPPPPFHQQPPPRGPPPPPFGRGPPPPPHGNLPPPPPFQGPR